MSESFLSWHPGGEVAISQVISTQSSMAVMQQVITIDIDAFEAFHSPQAYLELNKYCVGELEVKDRKTPQGNGFHSSLGYRYPKFES